MAYKSKRELLEDLEDNTGKDIGAEDVSSIVDSIYGPKLIYAGIVDDGQPLSIDFYFDPDFFQAKGYNGTSGGQAINHESQIYQFTNLGTGIPDGWSGNINGINTGSAVSGETSGAGVGLTIKVFGAGGVVTDYEIVRQGGGFRNGDEITFAGAGFTTSPVITYNGPLRGFATAGDSHYYRNMTFNHPSGNGNHTQINSIVSMVPYALTSGTDMEDLYARVGTHSTTNPFQYYDENKLFARAGYDGTTVRMNVQIWRVNGNI